MFETYQEYMKLWNEKLFDYHNITQIEPRVFSTEWVINNVIDNSGSLSENTEQVENLDNPKKITFLNKKNGKNI